MKLQLCFSTCPNDTFMFYAMVNRKINTKGYEFDVYMADIEDLNLNAQQHNPHISKISFGAYPELASKYQLMDSGSALGQGVGPLLVSKHKIYPDEVADITVALPGKHTTAHQLFNLAYPKVKGKKFYLFSDIEEAILSNEVDAGVIIHESRFTYQSKGLQKISDLGEIWEQQTKLPVPLGGIAIASNLPEHVKTDMVTMLKESIEYGFENFSETLPYVKRYAQEMDETVMLKHIKLYVNNYSISLGKMGQQAIAQLLYPKNNQKNYKDIFISTL